MNLGLDREETAADRSSQSDCRCRCDGDLGPWPSAGVRCFRVRKRIHVDVPNKPMHLHFRFHIRFIQVHQKINAVDP